MIRRGISPIVGVVLLIAIVMAAGTIIFIWAKGFIVVLGPVGLECEEMNFEAGIFDNSLEAINRGNVDIYGFEIKVIGEGSVEVRETINEKLESGESKTVKLRGNYGSGDELLIVPISQDGFVCDDRFGFEFEVKNRKKPVNLF